VYSGKEARQLLQEHADIAIILLDVVMESDDAGLQIVRYIREELHNPFVRIIIRTGQAGRAPEKKVIVEYDINNYTLKSMLTDQGLYTAIISALRSYRDLRLIDHQRKALEQAMEEAQIAHNARIQFLANMGHELRTPLTGILGYTDLMLMSDPSKEHQKYLTAIKTSGWSLCEVLDNVLNLTEIVEGRFVLQEELFSLRRIVDEIMRIVTLHAKWKNLQTSYHIDPDVPDELFGDERRLKQVLINLLVNAMKHTTGEPITLNISQFRDQSSHLLFSVNDPECNSVQEKYDHRFRPVRKEQEIMDQRFTGAGLGLAISKDIIEKMNGMIWVKKGSEQARAFHFSIRFQLA
jgi:signal transduction histidine kinase